MGKECSRSEDGESKRKSDTYPLSTSAIGRLGGFGRRKRCEKQGSLTRATLYKRLFTDCFLTKQMALFIGFAFHKVVQTLFRAFAKAELFEP